MSEATAGWLVDGSVAAGIVAVAALALSVRDRTTAVVLFVVFGLLVSGAYARLDAPDIALAEAAIGAAVTGALLLGATKPLPGGRRASAGTPTAASGRSAAVSVLVLLTLLAGAALLARELLSRPATRGLSAQVGDRIGDSGVDHPVTAVLLAFRAYDTFIEVVVVLLAAVVALALLPGRDLDAVRPLAPPPAALPVLTRIVVPVGVVVGGWVLFVGAYEPGGAFQAGTVVAGTLVLLWFAGRRSPVLAGWLLRWGLASGAAVFLGVALVTLALGDGLLDYGGAAPAAIVAIETAIAVSVGITLAALYLAEEPVPDDEQDESDEPADDRRSRA